MANRTEYLLGPSGAGLHARHDEFKGIDTLKSITIYSKAQGIAGINFEYVEHGTTKHHLFGKHDGTPHKVTFGREEFITSINGTLGEVSNDVVISSLTIHTNSRTSGPYGQETGVRFNLPTVEKKIRGFVGRAEDLLEALGIIIW